MIRTIAVVGNDIHAWMTATWLANRLLPHKVAIHVFTQPSTVSQKSLYVAYHAFRKFLQSVDIDEIQFIKQTDASMTLANHFIDWAGRDHEFYHAPAEYGVHHITPFHHLAKRLQRESQLRRYDEFSLGATAARLGKFQLPSTNAGDITASYDYGYQFRADLFCALLRQRFSQVTECVIHDASISAVQTAADGCIKSVVLCSDDAVQADLFIDCVGTLSSSRQASSLKERPAWSDWSDYFPVTCLQTEIAEQDHPLPCITLQRTPDRIIKTLSSRNQKQSDFFILADALSNSDSSGLQSSDLQNNDLQNNDLKSRAPGALKHAWIHNCITLGPALVDLPFLVGSEVDTSIEILAQLDRLYPHDPADKIIAAEFNRLTSEYLARLRDSQALPLSLTQWQQTVETAADVSAINTHGKPKKISLELEWKLELYRTFGKMPAYEHEPIDDADWINLLAGMGIWPQRDDMMVQTRPADELHQLAQQILRLVADRAAAMPTLKQWLQQCCGNAF